jgi:hypothetical protein
LYDRTKTGQFGVGFNAVYHLTDVPSFITRGPDISSGGTFCVFDPHCWHAPIATTDSPGMKMKLQIARFLYDRTTYFLLPNSEYLLYQLVKNMRCCKHTRPGLWGVTCIFCQRTLRLEGAEISQQERGSIFIPDRNCVMRSVSDVCYDEKDFPYDDDGE